jgi:long-chain acyl-CoA synthetase
VETYNRIFDLLDYRLAQHPSSITLNRREDKKTWTSYSSAAIKDMSDKVSRGLLALGLNPGDKIAIISTSNRPEWHWVDFGAQQAGIINVPIYPTISPMEYEYILNDAEVQYVFVSDRMLWRKINQVRDKVPTLKEIYSFEQIEETPNYRTILNEPDTGLDSRIQEIKDSIKPGILLQLFILQVPPEIQGSHVVTSQHCQ